MAPVLNKMLQNKCLHWMNFDTLASHLISWINLETSVVVVTNDVMALDGGCKCLTNNISFSSLWHSISLLQFNNGILGILGNHYVQ